MLTALIVDDEPSPARSCGCCWSRRATSACWGVCPRHGGAARHPSRLKPDLLFRHPDAAHQRAGAGEHAGPGLAPHIVFITAYDEFALRAFEENALDYLLAGHQRTDEQGAGAHPAAAFAKG